MLKVRIVLSMCAWICFHHAATQNSARDGSKGNNSNRGLANKAKEKDIFFDEALDYEHQHHMNDISKLAAVRIKFPNNQPSIKSSKVPTIKYGHDSALEMWRLMSKKKKLAANTAANSMYVGGGFSTMQQYRRGSGTQEEGVMAIVSGLLMSLCEFSEKDNNGDLERNTSRRHQGRYIYVPNTFLNHILLSKGLHPRIPIDLLNKYINNDEGYKFFTDYAAHIYNMDNSIMALDTRFTIDIYSIVALDRRGISKNDLGTKVYEKLCQDTYNQLSTMIKDAKSRNIEALVITLPGSGVFGNIGYGNGAKVDPKYRDAIEKGAMKAIKDHGNGLSEIVICGHRSTPQVFKLGWYKKYRRVILISIAIVVVLILTVVSIFFFLRRYRS